MSTKVKIIASVLSLVLTVTFGIFGVLALTRVNSTSSFTIRYTATRDVECSISASSLINEELFEETETVVIDKHTQNVSNSLDFTKEINILDDEDVVDFIFTIVNNSNKARGAQIVVTPSVQLVSGDDNLDVKIYFKVGSNEYKAYDTTLNLCGAITLEKQESLNIRVECKIRDILTDSEMRCNFGLDIASAVELPDGYFDLGNQALSVGNVYEFGEYPQTYVGNELNEILKASDKLVKTGKKYTTYISNVETILEEFTFDSDGDGVDEKYAKLGSSLVYGSSTLKFSTGETVSNGKVYFFKVEPIKLKAITSSSTELTFYAVNVLGSRRIHASSNVWSTSEMVTFLNEKMIIDMGLENTAKEKMIDSASCKMYLASQSDLNNWFGSNDERRAKGTDLALATYTETASSTGYSSFWLRTPFNNNNAYSVTTTGTVDGNWSGHISNTYYGIRPVFTINI